jgi:uncharacterized LabA/DUF88 family protein
MSFNVAIFYDIENLLKGYSFSQQLITNLSLKDIVERINRTERLGKIAIQRAYANWSDPRLGSLRGEINELGIEPIQVFGFSRDQKKNAADIQLAIDAIDLAYIRPTLDVYVIVSGDGGFASLAKKLHEYGKTVIGCAYRSTTNHIFQAVCDEFIPIPDPEAHDEEWQEIKNELKAHNRVQVTDPKVIKLTPKIRQIANTPMTDGIRITQAILNLFADDQTLGEILRENGIYLSTVREAIRYAIPDFHQSQFGFPKFTEYLQYVCQDTPFCLVRPLHSSVFLTLRSAVSDQVEVLPDMALHSVEHYYSILAVGSPIFRLPSRHALEKTAEWIVNHPIKQQSLGDAIDNATAVLSPTVNTEAAKLSFLCFASAGIFERLPEEVAISEQTLTLKEHYGSVIEILSTLHDAVYQKIADSISPMNEAVLTDIIAEILPINTSNNHSTLVNDV